MRRFKELVKADIIGVLFLSFILGTAFLWLGDYYHLLHVSGDGEVSGTVLWLTALAIFWYAYETYQLKMSTIEQVEIQKEVMLNEFLPILEPVSARNLATIKAGVVSNLQLRNLGKGPAKYIVLIIGGNRIALNWSLSAGESETVLQTPELRRAVRSQTRNTPAMVRVKIAYQDIYGRKFQTEHIVFERVSGRGGYSLKQGSWDFKRLTNLSPKP